MDNDTKLLTVALVLMLLGFPLTALGTEQELTWLWITGLVVVGLGALIPPVSRYAIDGDGDEGDNDSGDD